MTSISETAAVMTPEQARAACDAGMHTMGSIRWLTVQLLEPLTPEQ